MKQNIFLASFRESFRLIGKNKALILIIFIIQAIFFSLLFSVLFNYSIKIGESAVAILDYSETLDFDETSITTKILKREEILGEDPLLIYREGKKIVSSLVYLLAYSLLIFLVLNGLNWALTDNLVHKKKIKGFFGYLGKFGVTALTYFLIIFLLVKAVTADISIENFQISNLLPLLLILVILYFMFVSLVLIGKNSFKDIAKKTFKIGLKGWNVVILTYLINLLVIGLLSALLFYASELNMVVLFFALLLFVFSFVYARVFLMVVVGKVNS